MGVCDECREWDCVCPFEEAPAARPVLLEEHDQGDELEEVGP